MPAPRPLVLTAFPVLLAAGAVAAAVTPQDTSVETHAVAGRVHYLTGMGGNVGVMLGDDGVLMVDDKFDRNERAIRAALAELGGDAPTWLVNTHWHGDHTGGNEAFAASATVVAHANVRRRLSGDATIGGRLREPALTVGLPVVTYADTMSLHVNGEEVRLIHLGPGHTDGDSVVWFTGSNVVHMGDLFFNVGYPFIDFDSGGDAALLLENCREVLELIPADARIIPGHGEATDRAGLEAYVAMIATSLERVERALAAGQDAEAMLADGLLDDLNERWGTAFISPAKWIDELVTTLTR